jgi:ribonuclease P protein subunit POP4
VQRVLARAKNRAHDGAAVYASRVQGRTVLLENPARESRRAREAREKKARVREARVRAAQGGDAPTPRQETRKGRMWKLDASQAKCVPRAGPAGVVVDKARRFALFIPLHRLWQGYMSELLVLPSPPPVPSTMASYPPNSAAMHAKLVKADYHGAYITGMATDRLENSFV